MPRRILDRLRPSSLTGRTLLRVALGVALAILASAATSYYFMFNESEQRARRELAEYVSQRVKIESRLLFLVRDMQQAIVKFALERYPQYHNAATLARFDTLFVRGADGAVRVRPETYSKDAPITGWLRRGTPLTDELKQRMVLFYDLTDQFKGVVTVRFSDLYFTAPEQLNIGTDVPGMPLWGVKVPADFDQNAEPWVSIASVERNPKRETVWIGAELDPVWHKLVGGIATPIDLNGRNIGTVYGDLLIDTVVRNLRQFGVAGAQHCLFEEDGKLIARTNRMNEILMSAGKLHVKDSKDAEVSVLWRIVQQRPALPYVGYDAATDQYIALDRMPGPGWYLSTALPGSAVRGKAFATAQWVLWAGLLSLALVLVLLTVTLRRSIARPLRELTTAAERIAAGERQHPLRLWDADELARLAVTFNDMMARIAEREAEIKRQHDALHQSEKLAAMGSLLAGVAHELNNPLFVVSGRAMMLEVAAAGTPFQTAAHKIRGAADRCARIVKTFLAMARQNRPQHCALCVDEIIRSCVEVTEYTLRTNGVQVAIERPARLPPVWGDADQLHQVFMNLIVNAQQAMAESPAPRVLRIVMSYLAAERQVEVRVVDSGPGIAVDIRHRIFDPYFTTKPVGVGTGVGLAVCLGIAQAHGGTLRLDTAVNNGATFVITLPEAPAIEQHASEQDVEITVTAKRILVVDDELDVRDTLHEMLRLAQHEVFLCDGVEDALQTIQSQRFDVILSDVRMPGRDGIALYHEIAARWPALVRRIVFITGDGLTALHTKRLRALNQPVIEKPISAEDLQAAIVRVCIGAARTEVSNELRGTRGLQPNVAPCDSFVPPEF